MLIYRVIAILILSIPMVINLYIQGSIVSSLIYVPVITLGLSGIAIFIDGKLEMICNKRTSLSKLPVPSTAVYAKKSRDIVIDNTFIKANTFTDNIVELPSETITYKAVVT